MTAKQGLSYYAMAKSLGAALLALTVTGCVNGYAQFYTPVPGMAQYQAELVPAQGEPRLIVSTGNQHNDIIAMFIKGYVPIGSASFNAQMNNISGALAQAKKIGAAYVVVSRKYTNTVQGVVPITVPTSQTSYSSGAVNAFGSGGFAYGSYSGMTTTYGSKTTYMPYNISRYDQSAIFFSLLARTGAGAKCVQLSNEEIQNLGTQRACRVEAIRTGSPAYNADIIPGDIFMLINGQPLDQQNPRANYVEGINHFTIVRAGKTIVKDVNIPATW